MLVVMMMMKAMVMLMVMVMGGEHQVTTYEFGESSLILRELAEFFER